MDKTHRNHPIRHVISLAPDQSPDVFAVGAGPNIGFPAASPGVHVEVQTPNVRMRRRVIRVVQHRTGWHVALELYPVEKLYILLRIRLDKRMQFTICNVVENPAVGTNVLRCRRQLETGLWIGCRGDHIVLNFANWLRGLSGKQGTTKE